MYSNDKIKNIHAADLIRALDTTGISIFMYYPQERRVLIPEKICRLYNCEAEYTNMPYGFANENVHPKDRDAFIAMYERIHHGEKMATCTFRSMDERICIRDSLTVVAWDDIGRAQVVLGVVSDATEYFRSEHLSSLLQKKLETNGTDSREKEVVENIASSIGGQYYAIYYIWLDTREYVCFQEKTEGFLTEIGTTGDYDKSWNIYEQKFVVPEDRAAMHRFADLDTLPQRLREHHSVSRNYRRISLGWARGTFIAGKRDEQGNVTQLIYTVSDINAEVELEEKQKRDAYEAEHDALTGVYNRKGFERILHAESLKGTKVGFAILDVDRFKTLNDSFGHLLGDEVLVEVAKQLSSVFYTGDVVARIGGDEFALLFQNCDASAWRKICAKLQAVHSILANHFQNHEDLSVTLSVGLAFSETGYEAVLYQLADEGLYETKKRGRAGCTLMGTNHEVLERWRDETLSLFAKNVMESNNTGVCQIEIYDDADKPRRLVCGELEKMLMGMPKTATPEECYAIWRDRIDPTYREAMFRTENSMASGKQTECTFLWNHPDYGTIFMRCGGVGIKKQGKTILSGYCHPLKDTTIIERQDDGALVLQALNDTFIASSYIDLVNGTAIAYKLGTAADYLGNAAQSAPALFQYFIETIVDPRDREIVTEFFDYKTLPERLGSERYLDIDYRSLVAGSWCRARLLAVRRDDLGKVTHALMTITALHSGKLKEVYTLDYNHRSLAALFDHLPCGIVMYEWKDYALDLVHVSKYYEAHFAHRFVKVDETNTYRQNDDCIHPDDLKAYREALKSAMFGNHELHHEYRVWDDKRRRYIWERVDAVITEQSKNHFMIYAAYSDITPQKEQARQLEKNHTSLIAALHSSNQLCFEYDPMLHTRESLTNDNIFGLPKVLDNYPEVLRGMDTIHPEDIDCFVETAHRMDTGVENARCDIRIKKDGSYGWYACLFNRYYDAEKERHVAILTVTDISLRVAARKNYEERLQSLSAITENTLCMTLLNLTKGTYELLECRDTLRPYVNTTLPLTDYLQNAIPAIVGEDDQKRFAELFSVENMLREVAQGNAHLEIEYLLKMSAEHYEWIYSAVDLIQNPLTGEVTGAIYSRSAQSDKMNQMLLKRTLEQDYLFIAAIFVDTDEFYLYNYHQTAYTECMRDYWNIALRDMAGHSSEKTQAELKEIFVKEKILNHLKTHAAYTYAYDGTIFGKYQRLEIRFVYADDAHTMLLASMRNITDTALLERFRHESEHDPLTDLYNRKTLFRKCRELLDEHPDERFAMLHVDMRHFRLYNTFFGDEAGDKLLCDAANLFRWMDADYDYWAYGRIEADVFGVFVPYRAEIYKQHVTKVVQILKSYRSDFLIEPTIGMYFVTDKNMSIEGMFTRATLASKMVAPDMPYSTCVFDEEMEKALKSDQEILSEMQTAIDQEQFKIYLQPKYALRTNRAVGAEALVRWIHPEKGLIPPNRFIPLFERNGFIAALDRYMWEQSCKLLSRWQKSGKPLMPISVNVSRISAYSRDTVSFLKALVDKYGIDPKYLELELTESAYVESPEEIRSRLIELQNYGFKILMDDFGNGYSSLNTLKDLPIDILKLDMKFLSGADNNRGSKILSSMIRMSKLLNLPVIAEGVESERQAGYLRSIGCEYVQGYLYARPMPVCDYEKTILDAPDNTREREEATPKSSPLFDGLLSENSFARLMDDSIPSPVLIMSYQEREICCLRANRVFMNAFNLNEDLRSTDTIIRGHLSDSEYDRLLRALAHCAKTQGSVSFRIHWHNDDDTTHAYLVNAVHEGRIGMEAVFVIAFIDEEPHDFFE